MSDVSLPRRGIKEEEGARATFSEKVQRDPTADLEAPMWITMKVSAVD